ncbi:gamma-glutamylcyclotransferase family protein [Sphingobium sp. AN558]|uniref:gamma-glutamylcyclotransferase family protein n=1 Tax=Sphingobium sp. AN558 TaxID=3133442 RepID=UPI0030BD2E5B
MMEPLLFVYGTLRPDHSGPVARWLRAAARHVGPAVAHGLLYRIADYPGFVPGPYGDVIGDLFALPDPAAILARLDDHEECSDRFPTPHEYRRELRTVITPVGSATAWVYVYAWDVSGLEPIAGGDFLA